MLRMLCCNIPKGRFSGGVSKDSNLWPLVRLGPSGSAVCFHGNRNRPMHVWQAGCHHQTNRVTALRWPPAQPFSSLSCHPEEALVSASGLCASSGQRLRSSGATLTGFLWSHARTCTLPSSVEKAGVSFGAAGLEDAIHFCDFPVW